MKVLPSLDKDTHAFRRCKSALTASSSLAYASMPASSSLPSSDFPSPKSPVEFLRGRNAVGGSAAKMAGWRLPMNRAMPYGIYARKKPYVLLSSEGIIVVYIMQSFALIKKELPFLFKRAVAFFDSELRFQHFLSALQGTFGNVFPHHNAC